MAAPVVTVGTRFGALTVAHELPPRGCVRRFLCVCDCGSSIELARPQLTRSANPRRDCGACRPQPCVICGAQFAGPARQKSCGRPECTAELDRIRCREYRARQLATRPDEYRDRQAAKAKRLLAAMKVDDPVRYARHLAKKRLRRGYVPWSQRTEAERTALRERARQANRTVAAEMARRRYKQTLKGRLSNRRYKAKIRLARFFAQSEELTKLMDNSDGD